MDAILVEPLEIDYGLTNIIIPQPSEEETWQFKRLKAEPLPSYWQIMRRGYEAMSRIQDELVLESGTSRFSFGYLEDSTSAKSLEKKDERDKEYFNSQADAFLMLCHTTTFEDGYRNALTDRFDEYYELNPTVSLIWLYSFYNKNQKDDSVREGILRILSFIDDTEIQNIMLTMVKASLNDINPSIQEVAMMVIENWRTEECLSALVTTQFANPWMKDYSKKIIAELKEEFEDAD